MSAAEGVYTLRSITQESMLVGFIVSAGAGFVVMSSALGIWGWLHNGSMPEPHGPSADVAPIAAVQPLQTLAATPEPHVVRETTEVTSVEAEGSEGFIDTEHARGKGEELSVPRPSVGPEHPIPTFPLPKRRPQLSASEAPPTFPLPSRKPVHLSSAKTGIDEPVGPDDSIPLAKSGNDALAHLLENDFKQSESLFDDLNRELRKLDDSFLSIVGQPRKLIGENLGSELRARAYLLVETSQHVHGKLKRILAVEAGRLEDQIDKREVVISASQREEILHSHDKRIEAVSAKINRVLSLQRDFLGDVGKLGKFIDSNHSRLVDASGNIRYMDEKVKDELVSIGQKIDESLHELNAEFQKLNEQRLTYHAHLVDVVKVASEGK